LGPAESQSAVAALPGESHTAGSPTNTAAVMHTALGPIQTAALCRRTPKGRVPDRPG